MGGCGNGPERPYLAMGQVCSKAIFQSFQTRKNLEYENEFSKISKMSDFGPVLDQIAMGSGR